MVDMQVQTYSEIMASWQPKYRLAPRGPPVYVKEAAEPGFTYLDCEWVLTPESQQEGLEIMQRALDAGKIWQDAHRRLATAVACEQILSSIPKVLKVKNVALTVCPAEGDHLTMLRIAAVVANVTVVQGGKFVIEQRSEPGQQPYGWHLHFYIQTQEAPSKVKQHVQQKLASRKYKCTYWATPADENWLNRYMSGDKGEEKDLKVKQDRILREQLDIAPMYDLETYKTGQLH